MFIFLKYNNSCPLKGCLLCTWQVHLPDEECSSCGVEFAASKMRNHKKECNGKKEEEKTLEGPKQTSGLKRRLESEMIGESQLNKSWSGSEEKQQTINPSHENDKEGNIAEVKRGKRGDGIDPPQTISVRFGSNKYSVRIEPQRKMKKVMRKLGKMVEKPVDKLVFKVERSGKVITGEETMSELVGEVIIVHLQ